MTLHVVNLAVSICGYTAQECRQECQGIRDRSADLRQNLILLRNMNSTKQIIAWLLVVATVIMLSFYSDLPSVIPGGATVLPAIAALAITISGALLIKDFGAAKRAQKGWFIDANSLQDAIFISDLSGGILGANKACRGLLHGADDATSVSLMLEPLHAQLMDRQAADDVLSAVLSAPEIKFSDRLNLNDGRIIERTTRPIEGSNNRIWILCDVTQVIAAGNDSAMHQSMVEEDAARTAELAEQLFHAKAELEAKQTELTRLANTDPMTGLWNRRRFLALAEESIERASDKDTLWVLMMDIDHFKRINDTYGHAAGDVAIRDFAQLIEKTVHGKGFVGRLGGEEFGAILSSCAVDEAYRVAEQIRKDTTQIQTECGAEVFRFTTSMGVASWIPGELSIEPALDRADKALYSAKNYGRNRVVGYE